MYCSGSSCRNEADEGYKTCSTCRDRALRRYYEKIRPLKPVREKKVRQKVGKKVYSAPSQHPSAKRNYYAKNRQEVYQGYGGKCVCCGESNEWFLTVDHVHNNGAEDRKKNGRSQSGFYRYLIRNNFPPDFQILCFNCNCAKHRNKGICPHQSIAGTSTH